MAKDKAETQQTPIQKSPTRKAKKARLPARMIASTEDKPETSTEGKPETQNTFKLVGVKLTHITAGVAKALRVTVENVSSDEASCSVQPLFQGPSKAQAKPIDKVPKGEERYADFVLAVDFSPPLSVESARFVFVVITLTPQAGVKGLQPERSSTQRVVVEGTKGI